ncbi:MAG: hypothetical protein JO222_09955 [Frankiales bacterium]|nr:hypothetical protein [Frankiales bacterium]
MPTDTDTLAELIADARQMPAPMLPHPRSGEHRTIDLTETEVHIPDATISLIDGYDSYGS